MMASSPTLLRPEGTLLPPPSILAVPPEPYQPSPLVGRPLLATYAVSVAGAR
jgi:hypothetical protein